MQGQYFGKVSNCVAVGARLGVGLAEVGNWIDLHCMVDCAASAAVIVAGEVGAVTADALSAAGDRWGNQATAASRVVTGGATFGRMHFTYANERRVDGTVAGDAVGGCR